MSRIAVIGSKPPLMSLIMADNHAVFQGIEFVEFAEISAKLRRFFPDRLQVVFVIQTVLTDLKAGVGIVGRPSGMPAPVIPGKRLIGGNRAILQFPDKTMHTDLPVHRLVPVVIVFILSKSSVIRPDVAFQVRVVRACRVHHDALHFNTSSCVEVVGLMSV